MHLEIEYETEIIIKKRVSYYLIAWKFYSEHSGFYLIKDMSGLRWKAEVDGELVVGLARYWTVKNRTHSVTKRESKFQMD